MALGPTILHADLDAFYASVEQLLDPRLRGRPIAVGGGVVLAASYEARAYGVRGGMSGWKARELCPPLRFVDGHFTQYRTLSAQVMEIMHGFTPLVEPVSIDEAFLDVSGARRLFGPPDAIGATLRQRVRDEVGLPISVGAASTKHLAKVASQVAKPDGLVVVDPAREREFLDPLPVGLVWGVGPVTQAALAGRGIETIGDLARTEPAHLRALLGHAAGGKLGALAGNVDDRSVHSGRRAASMGAQAALGRAEPTAERLRAVLGYLADRVATRLRVAHRAGRTVTARVRFAGMRSVTRSVTLPSPVATTLTITEVAEELVTAALRAHAEERTVTLLAVAVSNLADDAALQLELGFGARDPRRAGSPAGAARWAIDQAMDGVRARYGHDAVGYLSIARSEHSSVPDAFRELAERG